MNITEDNIKKIKSYERFIAIVWGIIALITFILISDNYLFLLMTVNFAIINIFYLFESYLNSVQSSIILKMLTNDLTNEQITEKIGVSKKLIVTVAENQNNANSYLAKNNNRIKTPNFRM
jgi:hypothetical protein